MKHQWSIGASIATGFVIGLVLSGLMAVLGWEGPAKESAWHPLVGPILGAVSSILPGLVSGILSRRSGFLVGAVSGTCESIVVSVLMVTVYWPPFWEPDEMSTHFILQSLAYAVASLITNGIAGLAGVHLAHGKVTSNLSSSGREGA